MKCWFSVSFCPMSFNKYRGEGERWERDKRTLVFGPTQKAPPTFSTRRDHGSQGQWLHLFPTTNARTSMVLDALWSPPHSWRSATFNTFCESGSTMLQQCHHDESSRTSHAWPTPTPNLRTKTTASVGVLLDQKGSISPQPRELPIFYDLGCLVLRILSIGRRVWGLRART